MAVPTAITELSTTASSNPPTGGETPKEGDNHLRVAYSFLAGIRDKLNGTDLTTATLGAVLVSSLVSSGALSCTDLTTTGNTTLGNAATDTLNVGNGGIIKDASGNVGIGATPSGFKLDFGTASASGTIGGVANIAGYSDTAAYSIWAGRSSLNGAFVQIFGGSHATNAGQLLLGSNGTSRVGLMPDGRLYGTALHNNANAVTGTATQYIASGTYTPTLTNGANVAASTAAKCVWTRLGNVVHVFGVLNVDPTAAGSATTVVGISLPIASDLATTADLSGTFNTGGFSTADAGVSGDTVNNRATLSFASATTSAFDLRFSFAYEVL